MSLLDQEAEKLIAFLKEQPLKSENAEQEGPGLKNQLAEQPIYYGETVKES